MFRGLSQSCNRVLNQIALLEASRFNHTVLQPEHILIALLKEGGEELFSMLDEVIDLVHFQCILESHMDKMKEEKPIVAKNILIYYNIHIIPEISQRTKNVLLNAIDESRNYNHDYMDLFSLFLASCADEQSIANVILMRHRLVLDDFRQNYNKYLKDKNDNKNPEEKGKKKNIEEFSFSLQKNLEKQAEVQKRIELHSSTRGKRATADSKKGESELSKYSTDITQKMIKSSEQIYGRTEEIEILFRILLRKQKNNPLLIGEAGVGKTALVEELARRISMGEVPTQLLGARILELNLTSLTAGTRYRGDFEERFQNIISEVIELSKKQKIFLFIDEFHHIIGTGLATGLTMDAAGILKPALARGTVSCIGATTLEEYRKHIEHDKAFQRRLQTITLEELSEKDSVMALKQIKGDYEKKHNVTYSDDAICEIVSLSTQHFFERKQPDKAIDLLDEIGSYCAIQNFRPTNKLKSLIQQEQKLQHDFEKNKLKEIPAKGEAVSPLDELHSVSQKRIEVQDALLKRLGTQKKKITPMIVRELVSKITGINQERLHGKNTELLVDFEENMRKEVVGQDRALAAIFSTVKRNMVGLRVSKKPVGSFLFLGPSGVGKSYTAKQLALQLYGTSSSFTRFDMSDYSEINSVSRLIGAPPGYVGYEESGLLVKTIRQQPRQVLLFDEIDKAHPRIFDIFLQILEEGMLQGQRGEYAYFRHSIIILTSNIGSQKILEQSIGFSNEDGMANGVQKAMFSELKKFLRPELINRFKDIIVFNTFTKTDVMSIIDLMLQSFVKDLSERMLSVHYNDSIKNFLYEKHYNEKSAARSIVTGISEIEDCIADALLQGKIQEDDSVVLRTSKGRIVVVKERVMFSKEKNLFTKEKGSYKRAESATKRTRSIASKTKVHEKESLSASSA